jgi:hypothetical protein
MLRSWDLGCLPVAVGDGATKGQGETDSSLVYMDTQFNRDTSHSVYGETEQRTPRNL